MRYKCCTFEHYRETVFAINIQRHFVVFKNSRLMHDLPHISKWQSDFAISPAFFFRENKTLAIISEFTAPKSHETASTYLVQVFSDILVAFLYFDICH